MNTYKYTNGTLESIELPELIPELTWGPVGSCAHEGKDYEWHCGLPSEALSAGLGVFSITIYRAASDRAPYPYTALVDFGDHPGEIYFPDLRDLIQYAREHAQLLQVTVLSGIAEQLDEAMRWLFDSQRGLFRDHVDDVYRRERRAAEARRRERSPVSAQTKPWQYNQSTKESICSRRIRPMKLLPRRWPRQIKYSTNVPALKPRSPRPRPRCK